MAKEAVDQPSNQVDNLVEHINEALHQLESKGTEQLCPETPQDVAE